MNLDEVFRFVAPAVRDAAKRAAAQLAHLKIRYALAGGLAVGAHGYIRATSDVDFLVGEEAFEHHGTLVTFRAGVPIEVDGIRIDYLSPIALGAHIEDALNHPDIGEDISIVPVVSIEVLIYMKLKARRRKDLVDVIELVKAGANVKQVNTYLGHYAQQLLPVFNELVDEAQNADE